MDEERAPAERIVDRAVEGAPGVGRPLSRSSTQYARSIENYLKAGNRPRWMERLVEIDAGVKEHERRLRAAQRRLREEVGDDAAAFARQWRDIAERWDFGEHNLLVHQHNEWYPIERQLPVDLRTRDYVKIGGRSYRRALLDAAWILERFPAE
jgi:uncharacterized protein YbaR (Trm112 family)